MNVYFMVGYFGDLFHCRGVNGSDMAISIFVFVFLLKRNKYGYA